MFLARSSPIKIVPKPTVCVVETDAGYDRPCWAKPIVIRKRGAIYKKFIYDTYTVLDTSFIPPACKKKSKDHRVFFLFH